MSNNNQRNVSGIARDIQERLRAARTPEQAPQDTANDTRGRRVTKDAQLIEPGEPVPADANSQPVSFSGLPAATFHATERR